MKELLLLLAHYPYNESSREILSRMLSEIKDWELFVKLVNDHGIIALAAYNIKEAGLEKMLPEKALAVLENGQMQSIVRNAWLTERWKEVNKILNEAGIKHILLKGMALEHTIYESKGLRQMTDNDILIKREEAIKAWELLQEKGFKINLQKSPLHRKIILEASQHLPALYKEGYALEIHTRLFDEWDTGQKAYNEFFEKAEGFVIGDSSAYILPKEIHIDYLVKHFKRHALAGEAQIRTFTDIKLLDPENPLEFPEEFIMFPNQRNKSNYKKAIYRENVWTVAPRHRLRFVAGDIFPSIAWMKNRYRCPGWKTIFYYPHRLGKLLWLI